MYLLIPILLCRLPLNSGFVEEKMGSKYVENRQVEFAKSYEESGPGTPIFFILSPGVDPLKDVEALGKKIGFTIDNKNFHNVSLGQVSNGRIAFMLFCSMYPHFEARYF